MDSLPLFVESEKHPAGHSPRIVQKNPAFQSRDPFYCPLPYGRGSVTELSKYWLRVEQVLPQRANKIRVVVFTQVQLSGRGFWENLIAEISKLLHIYVKDARFA
jgi:hypothetical protein